MCHRNNLVWDLWKYWLPADAESRLPSMPSTLMAGRMKFSKSGCGQWQRGQGTVREYRRTLTASVSLLCALKVHHGLAKIHPAWHSSSPEGGHREEREEQRKVAWILARTVSHLALVHGLEAVRKLGTRWNVKHPATAWGLQVSYPCPLLFQSAAHNFYAKDFSAFVEMRKIDVQHPASLCLESWLKLNEFRQSHSVISQIMLMKSEDLTGMISMDRYGKNILGLIVSAERKKHTWIKELGQCITLVNEWPV